MNSKIDIHKLGLHEKVTVDSVFSIMRVPRGWIYIFEYSSVFVPYSSEYDPELTKPWGPTKPRKRDTRIAPNE